MGLIDERIVGRQEGRPLSGFLPRGEAQVTAIDTDPVDRLDKARSNLLAILLSTREQPQGEAWKGFLKLCLPGRHRDNSICDGDLPLHAEDIRLHFGAYSRDNFWDRQFMFCPAVLQRGKRLHLDEARHMLPFVGIDYLDEQSRKMVHKVRVTRQDIHGNDRSHVEDKYVAKKNITTINSESTRSAIYDKWETMEAFLKNPTEHDRIVRAFASIDQCGELSIISDQAPYGDLCEYIADDRRHSKDRGWKQHIFKEIFAVADAIRYLRSAFSGSTKQDNISSFPIDLKPSNILVTRHQEIVDMAQPHYNMVFKVTDFAISALSRDAEQRADTSECCAPELLQVRPRPAEAVDIWAFGCILAMVMAWIYGGRQGPCGVETFAQQRASVNAKNKVAGMAWFFTTSDRHSTPVLQEVYLETDVVIPGIEGRQCLYLNPAVEEWLKTLEKQNQHQPDLFVIKQIARLLRDNILVAQPTERCSVQRLQRHLEEVDLKSLLTERSPAVAAVHVPDSRRASEPVMLPSPVDQDTAPEIIRRHTGAQPMSRTHTISRKTVGSSNPASAISRASTVVPRKSVVASDTASTISRITTTVSRASTTICLENTIADLNFAPQLPRGVEPHQISGSRSSSALVLDDA
ncbi:hypothetical protein AC579_2955 [Pseudocercospora musae]|uniref:Protein kinase domain-containing protein n=1 Tax=Pseudocercospora musae TaxID=113226 RepID=A0A139I6T4_9PEZI|nr:hypothetical protein AC579_2955 [Pseudocercospora musae]